MAYIEEEITDLSCKLDTLWDRFCKLERQLENQHLEDRVSTLEDIIETDGEKLDRLSERVEQKPQVQQTTEEFVRVVRCKDCMYCKAYNDVWYRPKKDALVCINDKTEVNADGYCSWGERRKG